MITKTYNISAIPHSMVWHVATRINEQHCEFWSYDTIDNTCTGLTWHGRIGARGTHNIYAKEKAWSVYRRKLADGYRTVGVFTQPAPSTSELFLTLCRQAHRLEESLEHVMSGDSHYFAQVEQLFPGSTKGSTALHDSWEGSVRTQYHKAIDDLYTFVKFVPIKINAYCVKSGDEYRIGLKTKLDTGAAELYFMNILAEIARGKTVKKLVQERDLRGVTSYGTFFGPGDCHNQCRLDGLVYPNPNADIDDTSGFVQSLNEQQYKKALLMLKKIEKLENVKLRIEATTTDSF
jgi:hypothetical protein